MLTNCARSHAVLQAGIHSLRVEGQQPLMPARSGFTSNVERMCFTRRLQRTRSGCICSASYHPLSGSLHLAMQSLLPLAESPAEQVGTAPVGSLAAALLLLTGYVVLRVTTYGRLQYITAAMLGRWVPKGGARVIQIGGGTRDLYYYPKDTVLVTAISPKLKKGLMGQAAIQAGVPVDVRQETPSNLSFQANSSVEAVVCLQSLELLPDLPRFMAEAHRVLKPGSPFIFLQPVKGEGLASAIQLLLGGAGNAVDEEEFNKLKAAGFDPVEWDIALAAQNPHAIGVALKSGDSRASGESIYEQKASKGSKARRKAAKAGFGKT